MPTTDTTQAKKAGEEAQAHYSRNEPLRYHYDLLYNIQTPDQLRAEAEYLATRLAGIADLCRADGNQIDTYLAAVLVQPKPRERRRQVMNYWALTDDELIRTLDVQELAPASRELLTRFSEAVTEIEALRDKLAVLEG